MKAVGEKLGRNYFVRRYVHYSGSRSGGKNIVGLREVAGIIEVKAQCTHGT